MLMPAMLALDVVMVRACLGPAMRALDKEVVRVCYVGIR